jgi:hypothetical protein
MRWLVVSAVLTGGLYAIALTIPDWGAGFGRFGVLCLPLAAVYAGTVGGVFRAVRREDGFARGAGTGSHTPAGMESPLDTRLLWIVWLGAILFRGLVLAAPPTLSGDMYRYLWDGKVLLSGVNPYRLPPSAPELAALRDAHWAMLNHGDLPTIYPPLLLLLFAGVSWISHTVIAWKAAMVACDLAAGWVWMRTLRATGRPRSWVVLYLWHPLAIVEFAGNGHAEAVGVLLVTWALAAAARSRFLGAGFGLTLAGLVKFMPWVVVPLLARRVGWKWILFPAAAAAVYLPFCLGGVNVLGSLGVYAAKWRANDFLFSFILTGPEPPSEAALIHAKRVAAGIVAVVWLLVLLRRRSLPSAYSWILGTALILSPVVHPWYLTWLLPVLLFLPHAAWWTWSLTVLLAYLPLPVFLAGGGWHESPLWKAVEYVPVLALVPWQLWKETRDARFDRH